MWLVKDWLVNGIGDDGDIVGFSSGVCGGGG